METAKKDTLMATITPKIGETGFGKSPLGQAAQQFFEREVLPHLG
jgi:hypothetical protein